MQVAPLNSDDGLNLAGEFVLWRGVQFSRSNLGLNSRLAVWLIRANYANCAVKFGIRWIFERNLVGQMICGLNLLI